MDMINERLLLDVVNGNPGATAFALELLTNYGPVGEFALTKMLAADIKGDKLYMLWNDCCNRVTGHALRIIMTHDIDDIIAHINYEGGRGIPYVIKDQQSQNPMQNNTTPSIFNNGPWET